MNIQFGLNTSIVVRGEKEVHFPLDQAQLDMTAVVVGVKDPDAIYSFVVRDLDGPKGEFFHLLLVNTDKDLDGDTLLSYVAPQRVGHRYLYELYTQDKKFGVIDIDDRGNKAERLFTRMARDLNRVAQLTVITRSKNASVDRSRSPTRGRLTNTDLALLERSAQRSRSPARNASPRSLTERSSMPRLTSLNGERSRSPPRNNNLVEERNRSPPRNHVQRSRSPIGHLSNRSFANNSNNSLSNHSNNSLSGRSLANHSRSKECPTCTSDQTIPCANSINPRECLGRQDFGSMSLMQLRNISQRHNIFVVNPNSRESILNSIHEYALSR